LLLVIQCYSGFLELLHDSPENQIRRMTVKIG
jgi:hypothetical protein